MSVVQLSDSGAISLTWSSEADVQHGIADVAYLAGWWVQREVHIPGWGRVDVLVETDDWSWAIEVKLDLNRPRDIRRALQQADGYARCLPAVSQVLLTAPSIGVDAAHYAANYPSVRLVGLDALVGLLQQPSLPGNYTRAVVRNEHYRRMLRLSDRVLDRLEADA